MRPLDLPNPREARPECSEGRDRFSGTLNMYKVGGSGADATKDSENRPI